MAKFFKTSKEQSPRKFDFFWSSYFQNILGKIDVESAVPVQLKAVGNTLDGEGLHRRKHVLLVVIIQILQVIKCTLAMLAQGLYCERLF